MKKISELISLNERAAVVTGGAGNIGRAIVETLLELGARVAVVDREADSCRTLCQSWNQQDYSGRAFPLPCDLALEAETRTMIHQAKELLGGLDILIHSAAFVGTTQFPGWAVPLEDQTLEAWNAALQVNLTSAFVLVQEARLCLSESSRGSIIFLGSIYGAVGPDPGLYEGTAMVTPAAYAASKGGLHQLTRYLAAQLGPRIRVNTIVAGGVFRNQPDIFVNRYADRTPLKRMAVEEDFKGAVAYLAGDLSAYVTGTILAVDGGWTAW
jgi:NAD(P)-dependent dehydrogenase (short-subunit alcohol dehydrogenase family)